MPILKNAKKICVFLTFTGCSNISKTFYTNYAKPILLSLKNTCSNLLSRLLHRSVAVLLISANPSLAGRRELLPWCGQAMVVATGTGPGGQDNTRVIHLQIKSEEEQDLGSVSSSRTSGVSSDESLPAAVAKQPPLLRVTSHVVDFDDVTVGSSASEFLVSLGGVLNCLVLH